MHFCKNTGLLTIYLKEINSFILFIFCFFRSKDGCTYRFKVILMLEWPRISLSVLISNPSSTHLVAKVWRNAWKFVSGILHLWRSFLKWYWYVRGSIYFSVEPVRRYPFWGSSLLFMICNYWFGIGMSQTGADSLAKEGKNYEEIINHFYIGVQIKDM